MPNWSFMATDHTNRFEDAVRVRVEFPARASEREEAAKGYPTEFCNHVEFPMIVANCNTADELLFCIIINVLLRLQLHEMREFLRLKGTYWAPFHPHRHDGISRWAQMVRSLDETVVGILGGEAHGDLLYGT